MEWSEPKEILLAREILLIEPYKYKAGTKERGSSWTQIAENLNTHPGFKATQRGVREHFQILEKKAKKRKQAIEAGTGISPNDYELDLAMEDILEKQEAAEEELQLQSENKNKKVEKDKETAETMRKISMETLSSTKRRKSDSEEPEDSSQRNQKKRRTGSETVQFLKEQSEREFELKREELEARKNEQTLQQQMISMLQQQQQQDKQQNMYQQQQMQQQFQQMQTMFMESQRQQAQLMASLFQKLTEHK